MIMAAFRFGFLSHVMRGPDDYWDPRALRTILDSFAPELKPPGYDVVRSALRDLEEQATPLFESVEAVNLLDSYGISWSYDHPPADRNLHSLATKVCGWIEDSARFGDAARNAVIETSPYRAWFSCGRWLGDSMKQSLCGRMENGIFQHSIHYLQQSVGALPTDFLEVFYWLKNFCEFDFRTSSPAEWYKQVPRADGIAFSEGDDVPDDSANTLGPLGTDYGPDVVDFESLFDYFYTRFNRDLGLVHFLLVNGLDMVPITAPYHGGIGLPMADQNLGASASESGGKTPMPTFAANVFRKAGNGWDIRFAGGELRHITRDYVGFFYIASVIAKPGKTFPASALLAIHGLRKLDTTTRTSKGAEQQAAEFSDTLHKGSPSLYAPSEIFTALRKCHEALQDIDEQLKNAEISEQMSERLQRERGDVLKEGRRLNRLLGQPTSEKNTRGAVKKAIDEAIQHIRDVDAKLGEHFGDRKILTVKLGEWCYQPKPPVVWDVTY